MSQNTYRILVIAIMGLIIVNVAFHGQEADACNVLVVMGYHEELRLSQELKDGIDQVLTEQGCEVTYQYLDVLRHPETVEAKAQEAFETYTSLQPDGVIAANDDTQVSFVVPFLKDQVTTPVVFCEVIARRSNTGIRPQM